MDCLLLIVGLVTIGLLIDQHFSLRKIKRELIIIMASQEEFDAQIAAANTALDEIAAAIAAEAEQIAEFIRNNPGVDTSALDSVVSKLQNIDEAINAVFEPPTPE